MSEISTAAPLRYKGYSGNWYVDIAERNTERLGVGIDYAAHPTGVGCFIVRFSVHGEGIDPKNYKHLTYRDKSRYVIPATDTTPAEGIKGIRLNKVAIKAFSPAIGRHEVALFAEKLGVWSKLAGWVGEQVAAEGFTVNVPNLRETLRSLIAPTTGEVENVLEFPDMASEKEQKKALKLVQKPEPDEDEDADDDEDGDDDDSGGKDWLN
jgi:hypothetical protein